MSLYLMTEGLNRNNFSKLFSKIKKLIAKDSNQSEHLYHVLFKKILLYGDQKDLDWLKRHTTDERKFDAFLSLLSEGKVFDIKKLIKRDSFVSRLWLEQFPKDCSPEEALALTRYAPVDVFPTILFDLLKENTYADSIKVIVREAEKRNLLNNTAWEILSKKDSIFLLKILEKIPAVFLTDILAEEVQKEKPIYDLLIFMKEIVTKDQWKSFAKSENRSLLTFFIFEAPDTIYIKYCDYLIFANMNEQMRRKARERRNQYC